VNGVPIALPLEMTPVAVGSDSVYVVDRVAACEGGYVVYRPL